jgi:hypothetical protein
MYVRRIADACKARVYIVAKGTPAKPWRSLNGFEVVGIHVQHHVPNREGNSVIDRLSIPSNCVLYPRTDRNSARQKCDCRP